MPVANGGQSRIQSAENHGKAGREDFRQSGPWYCRVVWTIEVLGRGIWHCKTIVRIKWVASIETSFISAIKEGRSERHTVLIILLKMPMNGLSGNLKNIGRNRFFDRIRNDHRSSA